MNTYLDKGLFMMCYVGFIHLVDVLTVNKGAIAFSSLWAGTIVLLIIGLLIHMYGGGRQKN